EKEISLVLLRVIRLEHARDPEMSVLLYRSVMARGHELAAHLVRFLKEVIELDLVIALGAGVWSALLKVFMNEVIHDLVHEDVLSVDHEVRDIELVANPARIV